MSAATRVRQALASVAAVLLLTASLAQASAQSSAGANRAGPNALQGFSQNRDQPVQIEAASLEVRDKDKVATFSGSVKVVQGDVTMRSKSLVVFYEGSGTTAPTVKAAAPGPGGKQQISRLEARGGVTVTQKEHTATGDTALFDMKSNTVTLQGNVVVSQGPNIMRGDRLVVDLTSGVSRVDGGKSHGPVRMLIQQTPQGAPGQSEKRPGLPRTPMSTN
jgi:lipopolysaccharide export system protein LptA